MTLGGRTGPVVWVDAQLPPALARWLIAAYAVNAKHVEDVELLSAEDPVIFAAARGGGGGAAIVITKDDDCVELVGRHGPPPPVVWVTCGNVRNSELRAIVLDAWPRVADLLAHGEPLVELSRLA